MNAPDPADLGEPPERTTPEPNESRSNEIVPVGLATKILAPLLIFVILVDGGPRTCDLQRWAIKKLDAPLSLLGIRQTTWRLFAPDPADSNSALSAEISYRDDSVASHESPDWKTLGLWRSFFLNRHVSLYLGLQKYVGNDDKVNPLWEPYADYLARQFSRPDGPPVRKVSLILDWRTIPSPSDQWIPFGEESPNLESLQFYSKEYP